MCSLCCTRPGGQARQDRLVGFHFVTHYPPEFDVLVEPGGEVGRGILCRSGAGKRYLHVLEAPDVPRHRQVHRAELADEALQILDQYVDLGVGHCQKGEELKL